ncbi:Hsp33 family molecular chaperone HslO [Carboxydothermus hydrogenoformans]|uniref:33 kDa chaperonin n=1 Tax=Carboxydothermus hydrogenoformans (strain ATCC BAA-161 / DSM 6008 / Z-2901) TaxID=246194 RepID=HSLO_CARHZ|nr:Hsp33 family molecular chaperone HslO [Carboxydothermus hydrogenoformans]Q3AC32.1 RecName: Full=33 kDa chaperonin; AltName: Full=Heat shock protein 33 homolog; Short=HSP33 [Carboxydothermus hydrogenoformans Z-2901]ABB14001.1 heat shock protein HSP33 [Carboxydothermus hydrogenoformans Z-2901]
MSDYLVKGMAGEFIRFTGVSSRQTVEEARKRHNLSRLATAALGRALTATIILASDLKNPGDLLTLRIFGDGPLGGIVCSAGNDGMVRGYLFNPEVELPLNDANKLDVGRGIGKGHLYVTKDLGLKEPYTGTVQLVSGEIAEDVAYYLYYSEQRPNVFNLGVLVNPDGSVAQAGGCLIEILPGAPEEIISTLEQNLGEQQSLTYQLQQGKHIEEIIQEVVNPYKTEIYVKKPVGFLCSCSREKLLPHLIGLYSEVKDEEIVEAVCHFCREKYTFSGKEIKEYKEKNT